MAGVQKEKYEGIWHGQPVRFNRVYAGHRFTDDECERLCDGQEIEVRGLKGKDGSEYGVTGRLANQVYNDHPYVGFERTGFLSDGPRIPRVFCNHEFTENEIMSLEGGTEIYVEGMISKKGNEFSAYIRYGERDDGEMGLVLRFD